MNAYRLLRPIVELVRDHGIKACEKKALEIARTIQHKTLVNVGSGRESARWTDAQSCDGLTSTTWFMSELHRAAWWATTRRTIRRSLEFVAMFE
jgi:hypothetical protein